MRVEIAHWGKVRKSFAEDVKFDTRMMTGNSSDREKGKGNLGEGRKPEKSEHTGHTHTKAGISREHRNTYCNWTETQIR